MRSRDTAPEAYEIQLKVLRSMTTGERLEQALRFADEMLQLIADGIRMHHPDYDDEQVTWAFRRLRLGDELFHKVWPDAPLLAP